MKKIAIALGSNLGDRLGNLKKALRLIRASGIEIISTSDIFETAPFGEINQPRFLNACVIIETEKENHQLLAMLKEMEKQIGRVLREKWGPREIDLDILFINQEVIETETLQVPHPEMHKRPFVLKPLSQLDPEWEHPLLGKTVDQLLSELPEQDLSMVRVARL